MKTSDIHITISNDEKQIDINIKDSHYKFCFIESDEGDVCQKCTFLKIRCQLSFMHFARCTRQYRKDGKNGFFLQSNNNFNIDEFSKQYLSVIVENKENM